MTLKEFIEKINIVENNFNINKLKYSDYNPWPYIRLYLSIQSIQIRKADRSHLTSNIKNSIYRLIRSLINKFNNPSLKKVDVLFLTQAQNVSEYINNKYFNRYSDSFIYLFGNNFRIQVLELGQNKINKNKLINNKVYYLDINILLTFIKSKLSKSNNISLEKLNIHIENIFNYKYDNVKELNYIQLLSEYYEKILDKTKPKALIYTIYYAPDHMAFVIACKRKGVKTIELQHGAQNNYHSMYTNWVNYNPDAIDLMPDYFWMWGDESADRIKKWINKPERVISGGNIWLLFNKINNYRQNIKSSLSNKCNILVSLQGNKFLPDYLIEYILRTKDKYNWLLRDHPRYPLDNATKSKLNNVLANSIDRVSNDELYSLLRVCDIHMTGFSTVAFEAQSFNKPTIFFHENAKNGYETLLNSNGLYYAENEESIKLLIEQLSSKKDQIVSTYMKSNNEEFINKMHELI